MIEFIMVKKYNFVLMDREISAEEFSRQSSIPLSQIEEFMFKSSIKQITLENAEKISKHFKNIKIINTSSMENAILSIKKIQDKNNKRIPIISILGHIDHGKTTLVDQIMKSNVAAKEEGGITQNISLHKIKYKNQEFFLIDTPGHMVFSDIRKFIINNTDLLILLVAADDGCKEQTEEIIKQSENVEKIICINKIDKPNINLDRIYQRLGVLGVLSSEYGGEFLTCKVSAKNGIGIEDLFESIILKADFMDFDVDEKDFGCGYVIDSFVKKGIGFVSRILLKNGNIQIGQKFVCGDSQGYIKRIFVDNKSVASADCNQVIDVVCFEKTPIPGSDFFIIENDLLREHILEYNIEKLKETKEYKDSGFTFVLKADNINHLVTLEKIVKNFGKIIASSVGEINDSDVFNAKTFGSVFVLWGKHSAKTIERIKNEKLRYVHSEIVYDLQEKIKLLLEKPKEISYKVTAKISVLKVFHIKNTCIAGCKVISGLIKKGSKCRVIRADKIITECTVSSMKREKDTINEATTNSECGIIMNKNIDFVVGDIIEVIEEDE